MGLLSNPSLSQRNKFGRNLAKHMRKLCLIFYLAGIAWFACLGHPDFHHSTYLSENALSPGLVYPEVKPDSSRLAYTLLQELERERETHKSTTPYPWILAKMKQFGLETYVHNFTLHYPFSGGKVYHGKNIYGIVRASRIGSTEGIVFSAPYRTPTSVHVDVTASVPLLLAFADFVRKKNYWAKDFIFLITEQEQLGMHAWLEAYHNGGIRSDPDILDSGNLEARAGSLQAAVNLEIQSLDLDYIDVKLEGLNGQLPNLDMFNLVQRITAREGILSGYKQKRGRKRRSHQNTMQENLKNMVSMIASQATGVPNGNHGLFHRYRIESLTLEAVKHSTNNQNNNRLALLKTLEGISRSLNNLLERFHQSYFFYILVQNDRFVSIGDFMPCLILLATSMFIKAFLLWLTINDYDDKLKELEPEHDSNDISDTSDLPQTTLLDLPYRKVLIYIGITAFIGVLSYCVPLSEVVCNFFVENNFTTAVTISIVLLCFAVLGSLLPLWFTMPVGGLELLHIGTLVIHGVLIIVLGLLNFSLGFFVAVISIPFAIMLDTNVLHAIPRLSTILCSALLNPMIVIYLIIWWLTLAEFSELNLQEVSMRAIPATMDAFTFGLMDSIIYTNWLYPVITTVFFPIWILFWTLSLSRRQYESEKEKIE